MRMLRYSGFVAAALLSGCAGLSPKLPIDDGGPSAASTGTRCRPDLSEVQQAAVDRADTFGMAVPAIIVRASGPSADRAIRSGTLVIIRSIAAISDQRSAYGTETGPLVLRAVGPDGAGPVEILSGAVVGLQSRSTGRLPPDARTDASAATDSRIADRFVIYKADVPDRDRPTSCDTKLRDGDFVYLRRLAPSAWVEIRDGILTSSVPTLSAAAPCDALEQDCYTDRYGRLLCTRFRTCAVTSMAP